MVTKQLRAVPKRGIGYGVLRYLSGRKEIVDRLESLPQAEISFNYGGRFVQGQEQDGQLKQGALRFGQALESPGPLRSARAQASALTGSKRQHRRPTVVTCGGVSVIAGMNKIQ